MVLGDLARLASRKKNYFCSEQLVFIVVIIVQVVFFLICLGDTKGLGRIKILQKQEK